MKQTTNSDISFAEFVTLVALMTSLSALAIDTMLPALKMIGQDLGVANVNDSQLIVGLLFLGMALGPIIFGPISDSFGRKFSIYLGLLVFIIGSLISLYTHSFFWMLVGRVLQGVGSSGPRVVTIAMIRDRFQGAMMARVMSFVTAIFILVPAIAPSIGQLILMVSHWRSIFILFLVLSVVLLVWFGLRQPETLAIEKRNPYNLVNISQSIWMVLKNSTALGYTLAIGFLFGGFLGYLSTAQLMFDDIYKTGNLFPAYFAVLALTFGFASLINAKLVLKFGMWKMAHTAIWLHLFNSLLFLVICVFTEGVPDFKLFMMYCMLTFSFIAVTFGNLNSMAMQPLGKIAGIGAAVIAGLSTIVSLPFGILLGQFFNYTLYPLVIGYCVLAILTLIAMRYAYKGDSE